MLPVYRLLNKSYIQRIVKISIRSNKSKAFFECHQKSWLLPRKLQIPCSWKHVDQFRSFSSKRDESGKCLRKTKSFPYLLITIRSNRAYNKRENKVLCLNVEIEVVL